MLFPPLPYAIHPIVIVIQEMNKGGNPWSFFNQFYHDWRCNAVEYRQELIAEAPPVATTLESKRWVAFAAATVEELCSRFSVPCPEWTQQETYFLREPWFVNAHPSQRQRLLAITLEPYRRRNVYAGGNVLDNKYEIQKQLGLPEDYSINRANSWILSEAESQRGSDGSQMRTCPASWSL